MENPQQFSAACIKESMSWRSRSLGDANNEFLNLYDEFRNTTISPEFGRAWYDSNTGTSNHSNLLRTIG